MTPDGAQILAGFDLLFSGWTVAFLVGGLLLGFVVGALPGIDAVNGAALVLGFSYAAPAEAAILLMAGIYAGACYAGAIPAILLNVPGTAGSAATALDGYPMTRKGEALRAISIARVSSGVSGAVVSVVVLVLIGPIAAAASSFGSPELFLVGLIALLTIGTLIGDSVPKGLFALALGLLLAATASSPVTGAPRFIMGMRGLYEEFPFVPVALGVFALTQMLVFASARSDGRPGADGAEDAAAVLKRNRSSFRQYFAGITEPFRYPRTLARSSGLGLVIGMLPGLGPAVSNFICYSFAKNASKAPEEFGRGSPEGIVASEASDNAVVVGTLIPTFTLGIPGSATAAVILSAALMHGWRIGPELMQTNGTQVYSVVWGLLLAALLIVPLAMLIATPLAKIVNVPRPWLIPPVLMISMVGGFAVRNSLFDVALALVFALIGVVFRLTGIPVVPMVLGLILGPLVESNLVRSLALNQYSPTILWDSTLSKMLWVLFVLLIAGNIRRSRRKGRAPVEPATGSEQRHPPQR